MLKHLASIWVPFITFVLSPVVLVEPPNPVISELHVSPPSGPTGTVYKISLRITSQAGVVPLLHQVREGKEAISVPLRDDGLDGDAEKGDGIYTGHSGVPPKAAKQTHRFEVFVQDPEGRKSNLLAYLFTVLEGEGKSI
jgi:hypothetical protein